MERIFFSVEGDLMMVIGFFIVYFKCLLFRVWIIMVFLCTDMGLGCREDDGGRRRRIRLENEVNGSCEESRAREKNEMCEVELRGEREDRGIDSVKARVVLVWSGGLIGSY